MIDPWSHTLSALAGAPFIPEVVWPDERTRLVVAANTEVELDLHATIRCNEPEETVYSVPPATVDLSTCTPAEAAVLQLLADFPRTPVQLAKALEIRRDTLDVRMVRMRRKGLVVHVGATWAAAR